MVSLTTLAPTPGSKKARVRLGRGVNSGSGGRCGVGMNGQNSRTGRKRYPTFEGGQTPLFRRTPKKRGFTAFAPKEFVIVNLDSLEKLAKSGVTDIDYAVLYEKRIIREKGKLLKVLGNGVLTESVTILADAVSESAKQKIEKAGGTVNIA
jgi:large subunit ribosomal protein L15